MEIHGFLGKGKRLNLFCVIGKESANMMVWGDRNKSFSSSSKPFGSVDFLRKFTEKEAEREVG